MWREIGREDHVRLYIVIVSVQVNFFNFYIC